MKYTHTHTRSCFKAFFISNDVLLEHAHFSIGSQQGDSQIKIVFKHHAP